MGSNRFRRRSFLLALVLILSLLLVSCEGLTATSTPTPTVQAAPTQAPPTQTPPTQAPPTQAAPTQAPPTQAPTTPPASAQSAPKPTATTAATQAVPTAKAEAASLPATDGLSSYRIHEEWRTDGVDGVVEEWFDVEYVAEPLAFHQKSEGMESFMVGTTYWTRFDDMPWRKTDLSTEEMKDLAKQLGQMEAPLEVEEQTPLDDSVEWLMGQPSIHLVEGSLTEAGSETVNDVNCKHYLVDSTYVYNVTYTVPIAATAEITEQHQGEIWLADQAGWPTFLVRAGLLQTTTTQVEGGASSVEAKWLAEDVTDINSPDIVIEPPE